MARSKYNAKKTEVDGIIFDSKKEAARYKELCLLVRAKEISRLILQPRFVLQDRFVYGGRAQRKIEYIADFKYTEKDGTEVVEDVKGDKTPVYMIKKKLFLKKYCLDEKGNEIIKFIES